MRIKLPHIFTSLYCAGIWRVYADSYMWPEIDFGSSTSVGIAGQYNGLSLSKTQDQQETFDAKNASLIIYNSDGAFQLVGSTSENGSIKTLCKLPKKLGAVEYDLYVGGNFTTIGSVEVNNIARYDPTLQKFFPLVEGLDGPVSTLYCDAASGSVYVGGAFTAPTNPKNNNINASAFGGSIAVWSNNSWSALPFKGFNGPVSTIAYNQENSTYYFGGAFDATSDGEYGAISSSQPINLQNADIIGGSSTTTTGFSDPKVLVCSGDKDDVNNTWLVEDNMPGFWRASFPVSQTPSSIELLNTAYEGRGTKSFRLLSLPNNAILNLSYVDPNSKTVKYCTDPCPLTQDNKQYQVFNIVNPSTIRGIQLEILAWYGGGGGLHGIQLYQSEITVRAAGDSDFPNCSSTPFTPNVTSSPADQWISTPLPGVWENVTQITIPLSELTTSTASLTLKPYIPQTGFYDVFLSTPSCLLSCGNAITVKVTINVAPGISTSVLIDQNNAQSHIDMIYSGTVVATSLSFAPTVVISIPKDVNPPPGGGDAIIFVDYVQFDKRNSSTPLSGLFQYSLASSTNSIATWGGFNSTLAQYANIATILVRNKLSIFIGGSFKNASYSNIVEYDGFNFVSLANQGLDGDVKTISFLGDNLLVGGSFNATASGSTVNLNNLASYSISTKQWSSISGGVNGPVNLITNVNGSAGDINGSQIYVAGQFYAALSPTSANIGDLTSGLALWDNEIKYWQTPVYIDGQVNTILPIDDPNATIFFGGEFLSAESIQAFGGGLFNATSLNLSPLPIKPQVTNTNIPQISITTGLFYKNSIIIGGHFQFGDIENIAIQEGEGWVGLGASATLQGNINTLYAQGDILYIGGQFTGSAQGVNSFSSLGFYNLNEKAFNGTQPKLSVNGSNTGVNVNVIRGRTNTKTIIVAGNFDQVDQSNCQAICTWNTDLAKWNTLGIDPGITGQVSALDFVEQQETILLVGGDMIINNSPVYLAEYDFDSNKWRVLGTKGSSDNDLPGPVGSISVDGSPSRVFIAGKNADTGATYLRKWDGSKFQTIGDQLLSEASLINQLQVVPVKTNHVQNNILESNRMLLISGALSLDKYGNVSTALFDGETFQPYILSSKSGGTPGNIMSIFFSSNLNLTNRKVLAVPVVILISVAIATVLVGLIIGIGLIYAYIKRRKLLNMMNNPHDSIPSQSGKPQTDFLDKALIESYMSSISSTEKSTDVLGAGVVLGSIGAETAAEGATQSEQEHDNVEAEAGMVAGTATGGGAFHEIFLNGQGQGQSQGQAQTYYAKYDFDARESAELGFSMGDKIYVIDTNDPVWWMGLRDEGAGRLRQGVFPSNYVTLDPPPYDHEDVDDPEDQPPQP